MADIKKIGASISAQFRNLNGVPPAQWPIVPRILCGVGVTILVLVLGWYFYWSSQLEDLDRAAAEEQTLKDAYKVKVQQAINLDGLRKQKKQVGEYVATLEKQLPSKAEMDALLSDINQAGLGRGLQFELFKPGQVVVRDYYAELPIDIRVTGHYHDMASFASDIANLPRIVTLNKMSLVAGKDNNLTLNAVAKTFRYLDEEEIVAQRKADAAKKKKKGGKK
ncbi:MAG TPA: type 4a pilus biogenesis protein PilO [Oxalicibacterium sp.]|nr:type 4a pilus biogenesis protein PilO [Oxalicibacterium sp.]